jgi:hypothetical protein
MPYIASVLPLGLRPEPNYTTRLTIVIIGTALRHSSIAGDVMKGAIKGLQHRNVPELVIKAEIARG